MTGAALVVWDDVFDDYDFGPTHPLRPLLLALAAERQYVGRTLT